VEIVMDRRAYWNEEYTKYWKDRVKELDSASMTSRLVVGDAKTEGDEIYARVFGRHPFISGTVLEVGCAWGRWFGLYKENNLCVHGIDISPSMIADAKRQWGEDPMVKSIQESEAESLPFEDNSFDNTTCLAVFDATYQDESLSEMLRVTKLGGRLYLTGKNDNYRDSDRLAMDAEIGARRNGHPNFFTDTKDMLNQITDNGHEVLASYFFPCRGDFSTFTRVTNVESQFYEYFVILKKMTNNIQFRPFSDSVSKGFRRARKGS
jgi:ubiquinone/menaquinone biosynthesis C-methylase UbiE